MKSLYGSCGAILANFGWTWDYLLYKIPWPVVVRMLADQPRYEQPKKQDRSLREELDTAIRSQ